MAQPENHYKLAERLLSTVEETYDPLKINFRDSLFLSTLLALGHATLANGILHGEAPDDAQ